MIQLLLIMFVTLSSISSNAADNKVQLLEIPEKDVFQQSSRNTIQNNKYLLLTNVGLGVGLTAYYIAFNQFKSGQISAAVVELSCNAASAFVDVKPSTANTIVGLSNLAWGAVKLISMLTGTLNVGTVGNYVVPYAYIISTIVINGVNAGYRFRYAKKDADPVKK